MMGRPVYVKDWGFTEVFSEIFVMQRETKIIDFLISHNDHFFSISQIAKNTDTSASWVTDRVSSLEERNLITTIKDKKITLARINTDSPIVNALIECHKKISRKQKRR